MNTFSKKARLKVQDLWTVQKNRLSRVFRSFYKDQHQLTSVTGLNRYPELFDEVQKILHLLQKKQPRILSYGCSTGEECFSLRNYFPESTIVGADINKSNLREASARNTDSNIKFIFSTPENLKLEGKFDVIFCLSVLCRWEDTRDVKNCGKIYPFTRFEQAVEDLCNHLNPQGLLVIYNSNFRFEDTHVASSFQLLSTPSVENSGFVHKFDASNDRVHEIHRSCVYLKNK